MQSIDPRKWRAPEGFVRECFDDGMWIVPVFFAPVLIGLLGLAVIGLPLAGVFGLMESGWPWTFNLGMIAANAIYLFWAFGLSHISYYHGLLNKSGAAKALENFLELPKNVRSELMSDAKFAQMLREATSNEVRTIRYKVDDLKSSHKALESERRYQTRDTARINAFLNDAEDKSEVMNTLADEYKKINTEMQRMLD